jgi:hypothetical protein
VPTLNASSTTRDRARFTSAFGACATVCSASTALARCPAKAVREFDVARCSAAAPPSRCSALPPPPPSRPRAPQCTPP